MCLVNRLQKENQQKNHTHKKKTTNKPPKKTKKKPTKKPQNKNTKIPIKNIKEAFNENLACIKKLMTHYGVTTVLFV